MTSPQYDFVIVGGGSAGSALGNRLSADPANRVLVLEAGRSDFPWDVFIHMPAALAFPIGSRFYDWKYESEPEPHMGGRRVFHARGKVLGGSSSINGMIFQRGNPMDYERWGADPGMETWDHAHCLPYFKRMENCLAAAPDDPFRGHDGPLVLERGPAKGPLFDAFFAAVQEAGYELTEDVNGYKQEGFAKFDRNVHKGRRLSAARAYLHPVMDRPNLEVRTHSYVTRIAVRGRPRRRRRVLEAGPARERDAARRRGDPVRRRDQLAAAAAALGRRRGGRAAGARDRRRRGPAGRGGEPAGPPRGLHPAHRHPTGDDGAVLRHEGPSQGGAEWLLRKSGPGATNHFEAGGFVRSNDDVAYPNLMYHFLPIAVRYDGTLPEGGGGHGYQVHVGPMYSDARGTCKIVSKDPRSKPALLFNYLSTDQDRREWAEAIRVTRAILDAPAFAPFSGGEISPGKQVETEEQILEWVGKDAETALHPSCTAKMGIATGRRRRPAEHARARVAGAERRRCVGVPVRHQRQHLRAGDDDRGEGRRPDPRQHAAGARAGRVPPPPQARGAHVRLTCIRSRPCVGSMTSPTARARCATCSAARARTSRR